MPYLGELPGMVWDEAQGRYFRVALPHVTPAGSAAAAHTLVTALRNLREMRAEAARQAEISRREPLVVRSSITSHYENSSASGAVLSREFGHLSGQKLYDSCRAMAIESWAKTVILPAERLAENLPMNAFDYNDVTDELFICGDRNTTLFTATRGIALKDGKPHYLQTFQRKRQVATVSDYLGDGQISAIVYTPWSHCLMATWNYAVPGMNMYTEDCASTMGQAMNWEHDIRTFVVAPRSSTCSYAFSAGSRVKRMSRDGTVVQEKLPSSQKGGIGEQQPIMAMEFLAKRSPNCLISGSRGGLMPVYDFRISGVRSPSSTALTLVHPTMVTNIKEIDENRIVVAGTRSTMCQYDLRYVKRSGPGTHWAPNEIDSHQNGTQKECTETVLHYNEHVNEAHSDLGFDVDTEAGLVAAAQRHESKNCYVKIFDLFSGALLKTLTPGSNALSYGSKTQAPEVKALKFVNDTKHRNNKSLWVAEGTRIIRHGC